MRKEVKRNLWEGGCRGGGGGEEKGRERERWRERQRESERESDEYVSIIVNIHACLQGTHPDTVRSKP